MLLGVQVTLLGVLSRYKFPFVIRFPAHIVKIIRY